MIKNYNEYLNECFHGLDGKPVGVNKNHEPITITENYGHELDKLQKAFDAVVKSMGGSSVITNGPIDVWIDFGIRNQFCDDNGTLLKPLK